MQNGQKLCNFSYLLYNIVHISIYMTFIIFPTPSHAITMCCKGVSKCAQSVTKVFHFQPDFCFSDLSKESAWHPLNWEKLFKEQVTYIPSSRLSVKSCIYQKSEESHCSWVNVQPEALLYCVLCACSIFSLPLCAFMWMQFIVQNLPWNA